MLQHLMPHRLLPTCLMTRLVANFFAVGFVIGAFALFPTYLAAQAPPDPGTAPSGEFDADADNARPAVIPGNTPGATDAGRPTLMRMLMEGSTVGLIIVSLLVVLSMISVYFIIEHSLLITRNRFMPANLVEELEKLVASGDIPAAIELCREKENYSLVAEVVLAGLQRYRSSEFGFADYRSAVEEAGEDQTGRLYRRTEVLNVIAAIAPMLGLTGTVVGMIEAFNTIAARHGMARPEELAGAIGEALITTLLGLMVAIPTMVALSYFRNKIDSLAAEAGKRVEHILLPLGRKR